tara:strand:- start:186 stop:1181 length:996 start_codon:yes stop_codon:yes gene_type:complete
MKTKLLILSFFIIFGFSKHINAQNKNQQKITVALDGTGDFKSIQEAINATNNTIDEIITIYIKNGVYKEKIQISETKHHIKLVGENRENTIITFDDYSGKIDAVTNEKIGTSTSYTMLVNGNNIEIHNLTIENSTCNVGQAVALHVIGNQFFITNSNIFGCQDTLYATGTNSNQLYLNCTITGTTDFIFGAATAVFKDCIIISKKNSYITAASTPENSEFGYVFLNCNLIANPEVSETFLGRPWRPYAQTVFIKCNLGSHIIPEGWNAWEDARFPNKDKTAFYAEYKNKGKGAISTQRVPWSRQLTVKEAKKYTIKTIFKNCSNWSALSNK